MTTILSQILEQINSGLSPAQAVEAVIPGADFAYWQRRIAQQEAPAKQKPKRKATRRTSRPGNTKMAQTARVLNAWGRATSEALERVNGDEDTTARLVAAEAAWHESNSILCAGGVLVR